MNDTLSDRLDAGFAEAWKPSAGDKLIGEIVDIDLRSSDYGPPYPILTVRDDTGREQAFHAFHTVARNELAKKKPQVGDRIGVVYVGQGEAKPGMSPAHLYKVLLDRAQAQQVDWGRIAESEDPGPETDEGDPGPETDLKADAREAGPDEDIPF